MLLHVACRARIRELARYRGESRRCANRKVRQGSPLTRVDAANAVLDWRGRGVMTSSSIERAAARARENHASRPVVSRATASLPRSCTARLEKHRGSRGVGVREACLRGAASGRRSSALREEQGFGAPQLRARQAGWASPAQPEFDRHRRNTALARHSGRPREQHSSFSDRFGAATR
jgi:hypothetical protein